MTDVKARERAALDFFEALLKLEFPGRRVAVTPAPFSDDVPDDTVAELDGSGVLDVTVGTLEHDPAWVCFRCMVQFEVERHDWPEAARILLEKTRLAFGSWHLRGGACSLATRTADGVVIRALREAARRANWDAQEGPPHLRTGRFTPTGKGSGHGT